MAVLHQQTYICKDMKIFSIFFIYILYFSQGIAQITLSDTNNVEYYVRNVLLGPGVEVSNIKYTGRVGSMGQFNAPAELLGIGSGLMLSTGNIKGAKGPNMAQGFTTRGKTPESEAVLRELRSGDKDLNELCKGKTIDIAIIEFDFIPKNNKLEFNYVFASEEYPEYVGSTYNDVFGFFLSGPEIKNKKNLAVLPNNKTPISVNTINKKNNKEYFRNNPDLLNGYGNQQEMELSKQIQYDGLTIKMQAKCSVIPKQTYHIKIAIGDVADDTYDSVVFLEAGSFGSIDESGKENTEEQKTFEVVEVKKEEPLLKKEIISTPEPVKIDDRFKITDILFENNSAVITETGRQQLDRLAEYLLKNASLNSMIKGYCDNNGSKDYNQKLSEKRAIAVVDLLISKGIARERFDLKGFSFENPKSDNDTEEGRSRNRRVEIVLEEK